jgi:hypothetical protein
MLSTNHPEETAIKTKRGRAYLVDFTEINEMIK